MVAEREYTRAGSVTTCPPSESGFLISISQVTSRPATTVAGAHVTDEVVALISSCFTATATGFVPDTNVASSFAVTNIVAAVAETPGYNAVYEPMAVDAAINTAGRPLVTTLVSVLVETTARVKPDVPAVVEVGLSYLSRAKRSQTRTLDPGTSVGQLNVDLSATAAAARTVTCFPSPIGA